jgi:hypothetical protein
MRKTSLLIALCTLGIGSAFATGMPAASTAMTPSGAGMDVTKEISTALDHAQMASNGQDVKIVHEHLHHVINCLVGPQGPEFDSTAEDPCKGMGNGAMNDVDSKSDQHKKLDKALSEAKDGLKKDKVKGAQSEAKEVVKELQDAQKASPTK